MNEIQFNPKDKSATLTYDQLARTMRLGDSTGNMPKQVPYQPGELLIHIKNTIKQYSGLDIIEQPVVVREPYMQSNLNKTREGLPLTIEDYLVKRFVTKFDLPLIHYPGTQDEMQMSVALTYAYTDSIRGIQVAFGQRVSVCDNLIAFGEYHFSTYGNSKISFEDGMQLLTHWCQNMQTVNERYKDAIEWLKEWDVEPHEFQRIIGSLFEKAVRSNNGEQVIAPLNQSQVAAMVQYGRKALEVQKEGVMGEYMTAWDIMSWGTNTLKANTSDMVELLKNTAQYNDFIHREFKCPVIVSI